VLTVARSQGVVLVHRDAGQNNRLQDKPVEKNASNKARDVERLWLLEEVCRTLARRWYRNAQRCALATGLRPLAVGAHVGEHYVIGQVYQRYHFLRQVSKEHVGDDRRSEGSSHVDEIVWVCRIHYSLRSQTSWNAAL
jgi:hypothetical protein